MMSLFDIQNLGVQRGGQTVLSVPALSVKEGEVLAVIGPNGAGKSTLLLTLAGLLPHSRGQISFRGQPLASLDDLAYRRRIGLVMQEPLLLDDSVFNNIAAGLRFRHVPRPEITRRVEHWLARLGVAHLHRRPARKLSGGEAQRVSLARAFVLEPELLLLDEPFSALDTPTRTHLLEDLQALLKETGLTAAFITHDLDEALLLGERVAVLIGGTLRQVGTPEQVFSSPTDGEVAAFVGVETILPGQVVKAEEGQVVVQAGGLRLEAVSTLAVGRNVLFCLRPEDVTIYPPEIPFADGQKPHPPASSARNRLQGRVQSLTPQGPLVRVVVNCGFPLMALITRTSARELQLAEGLPVSASFKASAAHLIPR
ncbi:MAG TPA: ABC transporter ATP-binding protein [Anaerolineales bacterium]|nr:ABC transporter ATP-binding protein [Anaerolineales bacterium]